MDKRSLEQQANDLLREDAKRRGTTLFREGILDERRQATIAQREMPMSAWLHMKHERK
jgi:hypothetical protein